MDNEELIDNIQDTLAGVSEQVGSDLLPDFTKLRELLDSDDTLRDKINEWIGQLAIIISTLDNIAGELDDDAYARQVAGVVARRARYAHELADAKRSLEYLINATPTGEVRDDLTTANVFLLTAEGKLADHDII